MKSILSPILLQRITRPATNWLAHQVNTGKLIIANWFHPLEYQLAGIPVDNKSLENKTNEAENIFDNFLWFAVPKSKISPSRKRQKHLQYFPDPVEWQRCERCGESKLPHRICSDKAEICAMRPEEYEQYKAAEKANEKKE